MRHTRTLSAVPALGGPRRLFTAVCDDDHYLHDLEPDGDLSTLAYTTDGRDVHDVVVDTASVREHATLTGCPSGECGDLGSPVLIHTREDHEACAHLDMLMSDPGPEPFDPAWCDAGTLALATGQGWL